MTRTDWASWRKGVEARHWRKTCSITRLIRVLSLSTVTERADLVGYALDETTGGSDGWHLCSPHPDIN